MHTTLRWKSCINPPTPPQPTSAGSVPELLTESYAYFYWLVLTITLLCIKWQSLLTNSHFKKPKTSVIPPYYIKTDNQWKKNII